MRQLHTAHSLCTLTLTLVLTLVSTICCLAITPPDLQNADYQSDVSHIQSDAHFVINLHSLIPTRDLQRFRAELDTLSRTSRILELHIESSASPDGPLGFNTGLARRRAMVMERYLRDNIEIPDSVVEVVSIAENWEGLRRCIVEDTTLAYRDEMLSIIDSRYGVEEKERQLRRLAKGRAFLGLVDEILPSLRYTYVRAVTPERVIEYRSDRITIPPMPLDMSTLTAVPEPIDFINLYDIPDPWIYHWYLSTNIPALGMGIVNLAAEADIARHWTVRLDVSHCGWDYYKSTVKFRNFAVYPEVRWWTHPNNIGFFIDAHLGFAYYNFAFDGRYRYQDRDGRTPAYGGGIGIGGRWFISHNHHWLMEVSVGAGAYPLDYDLFDNTPNYRDGLLMDRRKRIYWGIDEAAISIVYRFGPMSEWERRKRDGEKRRAQEGGDER